MTSERAAADAVADRRPLLRATPCRSPAGAQLVPCRRPARSRCTARSSTARAIRSPTRCSSGGSPTRTACMPQREGSRARELGHFTGFGRARRSTRSATTSSRPCCPARSRRRPCRGRSSPSSRAGCCTTSSPAPTSSERTTRRPPTRCSTAIDPARRETLLARADGPASYRFDVHLQGERETVFLEYAAAARDGVRRGAARPGDGRRGRRRRPRAAGRDGRRRGGASRRARRRPASRPARPTGTRPRSTSAAIAAAAAGGGNPVIPLVAALRRCDARRRSPTRVHLGLTSQDVARQRADAARRPRARRGVGADGDGC